MAVRIIYILPGRVAYLLCGVSVRIVQAPANGAMRIDLASDVSNTVLPTLALMGNGRNARRASSVALIVGRIKTNRIATVSTANGPPLLLQQLLLQSTPSRSTHRLKELTTPSTTLHPDSCSIRHLHLRRATRTPAIPHRTRTPTPTARPPHTVTTASR